MRLRQDQCFRHPAERTAWEFLQKKGHRLLCHNYHARIAEIDLLTQDPEEVVHAVEVKSWKSDSLVHPLESITEDRRENLRRVFGQFLSDALQVPELRRLCLQDCSISFDLLWLKSDTIEYFPSVF